MTEDWIMWAKVALHVPESHGAGKIWLSLRLSKSISECGQGSAIGDQFPGRLPAMAAKSRVVGPGFRPPGAGIAGPLCARLVIR